MSKHRKYTKENLESIVKASFSIAEVCRNLGLKLAGGNYTHLHFLIDKFSIDTTHFTGMIWSKGKTHETDSRIRLVRAYKENEIFIIHSPVRPKEVKKRYRRLVPQICAICQLSEWMDKPIVLHVDHINGNSLDHRWDNLRMLCPNCHSQTETWGNKKRKQPDVDQGQSQKS